MIMSLLNDNLGEKGQMPQPPKAKPVAAAAAATPSPTTETPQQTQTQAETTGEYTSSVIPRFL